MLQHLPLLCVLLSVFYQRHDDINPLILMNEVRLLIVKEDDLILLCTFALLGMETYTHILIFLIQTLTYSYQMDNYEQRLSSHLKRNYINHWTCQGVASWYDIAIEIGHIATKYGILKSPARINSTKTENYPTSAKRPMYSVLDCSNTREIIGIEGKDWRKELEKIIRNMAN